MTSGITVAKDLADKFSQMKKDKSWPYFTAVIHGAELKGKAKKEIVTDLVPEENSECSLSDFLDVVKNKYGAGCCFLFYDFKFDKEGAQQQKLALIKWCDDSAPITQKMVFASSWEALKKACPGAAKYIEYSDLADITESDLKSHFK